MSTPFFLFNKYFFSGERVGMGRKCRLQEGLAPCLGKDSNCRQWMVRWRLIDAKRSWGREYKFGDLFETTKREICSYPEVRIQYFTFSRVGG